MEFRILGSLEVLEGGRALDVGGAKQRALLAVLLLNANQVVSNDRLIDALWEGLPPETAQKALQVRTRTVDPLSMKEGCCVKRSVVWIAQSGRASVSW